MVLRMSALFLRTLRDDPVDAEVPSHRLLVRAGYIRRVASGSDPGCRSATSCSTASPRVIREEMNRDRRRRRSCSRPCCLRSRTTRAGRWTSTAT